MTVGNGASAANDTALHEDCEPELVDVVYDGKSYQLPPELKDALLRQADYTRKTQELAEGRRALEADRHRRGQQALAMRGHFQDAAKVIALNERLAQLDSIDWRALEARDPAEARGLWQQRQQIKVLRDRAARDWSQKEQEHHSQAQRETAKRLDDVVAQMPRLIPSWSPELDGKLVRYGIAEGLSPVEMAEATRQNPHFLRLLHKAHQFDQAARTKRAKQTFDAAQGARPVTRVGGGGGTASRRTTDASGDALSADEWVKRERERMRKR